MYNQQMLGGRGTEFFRYTPKNTFYGNLVNKLVGKLNTCIVFEKMCICLFSSIKANMCGKFVFLRLINCNFDLTLFVDHNNYVEIINSIKG